MEVADPMQGSREIEMVGSSEVPPLDRIATDGRVEVGVDVATPVLQVCLASLEVLQVQLLRDHLVELYLVTATKVGHLAAGVWPTFVLGWTAEEEVEHRVEVPPEVLLH